MGLQGPIGKAIEMGWHVDGGLEWIVNKGRLLFRNITWTLGGSDMDYEVNTSAPWPLMGPAVEHHMGEWVHMLCKMAMH